MGLWEDTLCRLSFIRRLQVRADRHRLKDIHMGGSINGDTPIAGCFIRENLIKMNDLEVPLF